MTKLNLLRRPSCPRLSQFLDLLCFRLKMKHHIATFITLLLAAHVSAAPQLVVAPQIVEKRADTPQSFVSIVLLIFHHLL